MTKFNLDAAQASDYDSLDAYEIDAKQTDGVCDQKETIWSNTKATQYFGYFNAVPELKNAILLKSIWNVGKGYLCDSRTKIILEHISGWGKDTFADILFNLECSRRIYGDAYAEIIREDDGTLLNLKVLDPASIRHVVNGQGRLIRYEQTTKLGSGANPKKFNVEDILHLCNNRIADQIHGISDIDSLEPVILNEQQSFDNMNKICNFQAKPFIVFKLKTDDEAKIASFASKIKAARNLGEDMFIPDDENLLSYEVIQVNPSAILMQWRDDLRNKFYRAFGLPQIIPGGSGSGGSTDAKVVYLAFEQIVMQDQRFLENQLWNQLAIKIDLIAPSTMMELIGRDENKDAGSELIIKPSEINPGSDK